MESKIPPRRVPVTTIVECRRRPVSNAGDDHCNRGLHAAGAGERGAAD